MPVGDEGERVASGQLDAERAREAVRIVHNDLIERGLRSQAARRARKDVELGTVGRTGRAAADCRCDAAGGSS